MPGVLQQHSPYSLNAFWGDNLCIELQLIAKTEALLYPCCACARGINKQSGTSRTIGKVKDEFHRSRFLILKKRFYGRYASDYSLLHNQDIA